MSWRDRVDELLLAGETVTERVAVGDHELVVTSHRVLAFVDGEDPPFRYVDRPNVAGVRLETTESLRRLAWAVVLGLIGFAILGVALSADFAGVIPDAGTDQPGFGIVENTVQTLESLFTLLESIVLVTGLVAWLGALWLFVSYLRDRERRLVVAVHGDADLSVAAPDDPTIVSELETAIEAPVDSHVEMSTGAASGTMTTTTSTGNSAGSESAEEGG